MQILVVIYLKMSKYVSKINLMPYSNNFENRFSNPEIFLIFLPNLSLNSNTTIDLVNKT